ncbi:hypothetical protein ANAPH1_00593 [Anaplasma phagocytophilum]|nr:hypothetical protein ANAPH1_00593 [Anaplasma phagocytophilum]
MGSPGTVGPFGVVGSPGTLGWSGSTNVGFLPEAPSSVGVMVSVVVVGASTSCISRASNFSIVLTLSCT